jgi:hypothetical protein
LSLILFGSSVAMMPRWDWERFAWSVDLSPSNSRTIVRPSVGYDSRDGFGVGVGVGLPIPTGKASAEAKLSGLERVTRTQEALLKLERDGSPFVKTMDLSGRVKEECTLPIRMGWFTFTIKFLEAGPSDRPAGIALKPWKAGEGLLDFSSQMRLAGTSAGQELTEAESAGLRLTRTYLVQPINANSSLKAGIDPTLLSDTIAKGGLVRVRSKLLDGQSPAEKRFLEIIEAQKATGK